MDDSQYLIIIEKSEGSFSAYAPDLPGCVASGESVEEVRELMGQAIRMHIEALKEDGDVIPQPSSLADYVAASDPRASDSREKEIDSFLDDARRQYRGALDKLADL